jgi:hypothetical protein
MNNIHTRRKQAYINGPKKTAVLTKVGFVKNVWEEARNHMEFELQKAICGESEEYGLSNEASHLAVPVAEWFSWSEEQRKKCVGMFNAITMEELAEGKNIAKPRPSGINLQQNMPLLRTFGISDLEQELLRASKLSRDVITTLVKEAEKLLNCENAIQRKPILDGKPSKAKQFLVGNTSKRGFCICTV